MTFIETDRIFLLRWLSNGTIELTEPSWTSKMIIKSFRKPLVSGLRKCETYLLRQFGSSGWNHLARRGWRLIHLTWHEYLGEHVSSLGQSCKILHTHVKGSRCLCHEPQTVESMLYGTRKQHHTPSTHQSFFARFGGSAFWSSQGRRWLQRVCSMPDGSWHVPLMQMLQR